MSSSYRECELGRLYVAKERASRGMVLVLVLSWVGDGRETSLLSRVVRRKIELLQYVEELFCAVLLPF